MVKELKLTRMQHVALTVMNTEKPMWSDGFTGDQFERLALYGLLDSISPEGSNACQYLINDTGKEFLEQHPELPSFKMSEAAAKVVYAMLGNEGIDCAEPFNSDEREFKRLKYLKAVKPVYKNEAKTLISGYEFTDDGRAAFENTLTGQAYTRRIEEKNRRELADLEFGKPKWTTADERLEIEKRRVIFMRERGLKTYATELESSLKRVYEEQKVREAIGDLLENQDVFQWAEQKYGGHLRSIELKYKQGFGYVTVARCYYQDEPPGEFWGISENVNLQSSYSYKNVRDLPKNINSVIDGIALLERALKVSRALNLQMGNSWVETQNDVKTIYPTPEPEVQNGSDDDDTQTDGGE